MHLRSECPPISGRDHLAYRSYYFPIRNVIDGDLCEMYNSLDLNKQKTIAEELDRHPSEVRPKLTFHLRSTAASVLLFAGIQEA